MPYVIYTFNILKERRKKNKSGHILPKNEEVSGWDVHMKQFYCVVPPFPLKILINFHQRHENCHLHIINSIIYFFLNIL